MAEQRFPGYDVLEQRRHWDEQTRAVVMARLAARGGRRFFTEAEEAVGRPLLDRLLALDEPGPRVPVVELIDDRLAEGWTDGWRYDDMPPDDEAWRRSLAELSDRSFAALSATDQLALLDGVRTAERFAGMPGRRLWDLWMRYACSAYYSHPWAWNEIGFGGPAYPRGYKNVGVGRLEPWEVREVDARDPVPWARRVESARRRGHGEGR